MKAIRKSKKKEEYINGYNAFLNGVRYDLCPYTYSRLAFYWRNGWIRAELASRKAVR